MYTMHYNTPQLRPATDYQCSELPNSFTFVATCPYLERHHCFDEGKRVAASKHGLPPRSPRRIEAGVKSSLRDC